MYGALVLFESEFVHVVAISFTALVLTELLMVALTVRTWHWLMVLAEFFSLGCYLASLAFLNEYFGTAPRSFSRQQNLSGPILVPDPRGMQRAAYSGNRPETRVPWAEQNRSGVYNI